MASLNPAKFIREVREEANKVTWPSRRETTISTVMVLVLVAIAATFFIFIDWIIGSLVQLVLGI
jgi:preprotein translocase subunit SecE